MVDSEDDRAGPSSVQRQAVAGADEPGSHDVRGAGGLPRPAVAEERTGMLGATADRDDVPAALGVGQRGGQHVRVSDVRDRQTAGGVGGHRAPPAAPVLPMTSVRLSRTIYMW